MNTDFVLRLRDHWLVADGEQWQPQPGAPRIERNARVLCDVDGAISGAMAIKGPPAHAAALIERRLRSEGLLDGDSRVLVHHLRSAGDSQLALYTAIPLEAAQQVQAWADEQTEHALLFAPTGLLWRALRSDGVAVLQLGRHLIAVARLGNTPLFVSTVAFSDEPADLQAAASALAGQLSSQLPAKRPALPLQLYRLHGEESDDALADTFARVLASEPARSRTLTRLLADAPAGSALNPLASRLAHAAEQLLPWASAASLLIAAGLLAGSVGWWSAAGAAEADRQALQQQHDGLLAQLPALQAAAAPNPALAPTLAFLHQADSARNALYPHAALAAIRQAADGEVRVLRIRGDETGPAGSLQVEGRVADGRDQGLRLATFVERLRQAGYEPRAIDLGSSSRAQPTGFFAYQLTPLADGATP